MADEQAGVLITGGTGYLGQHLLSTAVQQIDQVSFNTGYMVIDNLWLFGIVLFAIVVIALAMVMMKMMMMMVCDDYDDVDDYDDDDDDNDDDES